MQLNLEEIVEGNDAQPNEQNVRLPSQAIFINFSYASQACKFLRHDNRIHPLAPDNLNEHPETKANLVLINHKSSAPRLEMTASSTAIKKNIDLNFGLAND